MCFAEQSEEDLALYGIDWDGLAPVAQWNGPDNDEPSVEIPEVPELLLENDYAQLVQTVSPLGQSADNGVDLFIAAKNTVLRCIDRH